jgi:hypothetical protein
MSRPVIDHATKKIEHLLKTSNLKTSNLKTSNLKTSDLQVGNLKIKIKSPRRALCRKISTYMNSLSVASMLMIRPACNKTPELQVHRESLPMSLRAIHHLVPLRPRQNPPVLKRPYAID